MFKGQRENMDSNRLAVTMNRPPNILSMNGVVRWADIFALYDGVTTAEVLNGYDPEKDGRKGQVKLPSRIERSQGILHRRDFGVGNEGRGNEHLRDLFRTMKDKEETVGRVMRRGHTRGRPMMRGMFNDRRPRGNSGLRR